MLLLIQASLLHKTDRQMYRTERESLPFLQVMSNSNGLRLSRYSVQLVVRGYALVSLEVGVAHLCLLALRSGSQREDARARRRLTHITSDGRRAAFIRPTGEASAGLLMRAKPISIEARRADWPKGTAYLVTRLRLVSVARAGHYKGTSRSNVQ
jgi:hypothetical protein